MTQRVQRLLERARRELPERRRELLEGFGALAGLARDFEDLVREVTHPVQAHEVLDAHQERDGEEWREVAPGTFIREDPR